MQPGNSPSKVLISLVKTLVYLVCPENPVDKEFQPLLQTLLSFRGPHSPHLPHLKKTDLVLTQVVFLEKHIYIRGEALLSSLNNKFLVKETKDQFITVFHLKSFSLIKTG